MSQDSSGRTLGEILTLSTKFLSDRKAQEPQVAAEWLAARLLNCGRMQLRTRHQIEMPAKLVDAMRRGVMRVAAGEPVQYVVGRWEFRGHPMNVDRRALIPRPETEQLVQLVLDDPKLWRNPAPRIVDAGTGSGCIVVSLAKERPEGRYMATDVSAEALELAKENAALNGVADSIVFVQGELSDFLEPYSVDAVVSNPPYIPSNLVDKLDVSVRDFEPRLALDGGSDGLDILRQIAEEASMALREGGGLFLELSSEQEQGRSVSTFLRQLGFDDISPHRDLAGTERLLRAYLAAGV